MLEKSSYRLSQITFCYRLFLIRLTHTFFNSMRRLNIDCFFLVYQIIMENNLMLKMRKLTTDNQLLNFCLPYARHYKPRLVYCFTPFSKTVYVLWPLALCMACIQERLLIKSGLWWRAYGIQFGIFLLILKYNVGIVQSKKSWWIYGVHT